MQQTATVVLEKSFEERVQALRPWRYTHRFDGKVIEGNPLSAELFEKHGKGIMEGILRALTEGKNPGTMRALDLGCLEGHYTDLLCKAGFGEVVAIDLSRDHVARANFLLRECKHYDNVTVIEGNVADEVLLSSLGCFDIILFHGLLYHLKDPLRMFDLFESSLRNEDSVLLLGTQYHGRYDMMVYEKPVAELQIKPLPAADVALGTRVLRSTSDGSFFERCSLRLNPAAVHATLKAYGYEGQISYDTPTGTSFGFCSHLVATKRKNEDVLLKLRQCAAAAVRFTWWEGQSVDSYDFTKKWTARATRWIQRQVRRVRGLSLLLGIEKKAQR